MRTFSTTSVGLIRSTLKLTQGTLYITKYEDGYFEYFGLMYFSARTSSIEFSHGFTANTIIGVANNFYANASDISITVSCNSLRTRLDYKHIDGSTVTADGYINVHVIGFWK